MSEPYFALYQGQFVALWDQIPDYMLIIRLDKSDIANQLYYIYDVRRPQRPSHSDYHLPIDSNLLSAVKKLFTILDYGGIIYTQDQHGNRLMRSINSLMTPRKEFVMRLQFGVEEEWSYRVTNQKLSDLIDFILNR